MSRVVIADSSPLIALINLKKVHLLGDIFGDVYVPPQVQSELRQKSRPEAVRLFMDTPPEWIRIRAPSRLEAIPSLHLGESAAISLATELRPALLLMDERDGRKVATDRGIPVTGTVGFLEVAAERGLIDLRETFDALKRTDFWFSHKKLDQILERFLERQRIRDVDRAKDLGIDHER